MLGRWCPPARGRAALGFTLCCGGVSSLENGPDNTLIQDPLRGSVRVEAGSIEPPPNVSKTAPHRPSKCFVAVEEELILRRANSVAIPACGGAGVENYEQQAVGSQGVAICGELITVWEDDVEDWGEASICEVRRQGAHVGIEQSHLTGCLFRGFTEWPDIAAGDKITADGVRVQ